MENNIYSCLDISNPYTSDDKFIGKILYHYSLYEDNNNVKVLKGQRKDSTNPSEAIYSAKILDWSKDFQEDTRHLPLTVGDCQDDEEYLIFKAKKRPVIILAEKSALDVNEIPSGVQRNKATNSFKKSYLVAPIFSCSSGEKTTSFGPFLTAKIQALFLPHFFYLMPTHKIIKNHSIVRLDKMFWTNNLNISSNNINLNDEVLKILYYQFKLAYDLENHPNEDIKALEEILQEQYNKQYKI